MIRLLKEKKAVALMAVILFLLLVMLFQAAILTYINNQSRLAEKRKLSEQAFYNADKGIEFAKYWILFHDNDNLNIPSSDIPEGVDSIVIDYTGTNPENGYEDVCGFDPFNEYQECPLPGLPLQQEINCGDIQEIYHVTSRASVDLPWDSGKEVTHEITAYLRKNWEVNLVIRKFTVLEKEFTCLEKIKLKDKDPFITVSNWNDEVK